MTKFRLTVGENGTAWGKQRVLYSAKAENAIVFLQDIVKKYGETRETLNNCWLMLDLTRFP